MENNIKYPQIVNTNPPPIEIPNEEIVDGITYKLQPINPDLPALIEPIIE